MGVWKARQNIQYIESQDIDWRLPCPGSINSLALLACHAVAHLGNPPFHHSRNKGQPLAIGIQPTPSTQNGPRKMQGPLTAPTPTGWSNFRLSERLRSRTKLNPKILALFLSHYFCLSFPLIYSLIKRFEFLHLSVYALSLEEILRDNQAVGKMRRNKATRMIHKLEKQAMHNQALSESFATKRML